MSKYQFVEEWDEDATEIVWQKKGRRRLNEIIQKYNAWQRAGFPDKDQELLEAEIEFGLQTFATKDGGEAWADELRKMRDFVKNRLSRIRTAYEADE